MKSVYTLLVFALLIAACKKDMHEKTDGNLFKTLKTSLADSLNKNDYEALDFTRAVSNKVDTAGLYFIRVPFKGKSIAESFLIIKMKLNGSMEGAKIIQLNGGVRDVGVDPVKQREWEGSISISSLNRKWVIHSAIHNGYIEAFNKKRNAREQTKEPDPMPEVVIVTYVNHTVDYSTWLWLDGFFYTGGYAEGTGGSYYGSINGGGGYSGGGDSGGSSDYVQNDPTLELESEYMYAIPGVDLNKVFNCFDYVPDNGATYSIKLCADIPSNGNPNASSTSSAVSAGHTFLIVTKTNGTETVTQSFGFYPVSAPSWFDPFAPVASSIRDNGAQEINASIETSISKSQFDIIKQNAISFSGRQYKLGDYNCTNYAMDVFNSVRTNPIIIDPYKVVLPGGTNPWGPSEPVTVSIAKSPQMLFTKLQQMKISSVEAPKITIDQTHNSAAHISKGECN